MSHARPIRGNVLTLEEEKIRENRKEKKRACRWKRGNIDRFSEEKQGTERFNQGSKANQVNTLYVPLN